MVKKMVGLSNKVFSINRFANSFKATIEWMLQNKYGVDIENDVKSFIENKNALESNPDSSKALELLLRLIVTRAWYYKTPSNFDHEWNNFLSKFGTNFRTKQAKTELINLVKRLAPLRIRNRAISRLEELLRYPSLKQFTEELYRLATQGKTRVLGEKGRDNYLRDFGYWDRIPMDRHEMRFILRTGIYHACSVKAKNKNDPLRKASLHDALTRFCFRYLKDHVVFSIDLGRAPGIVDTFIWSFCSKERYSICGSVPKCETCPLKEACLYAIINTSIEG